MVDQLEEAPVAGRGGSGLDGLGVREGEVNDGDGDSGGDGEVERGRRMVEDTRDCLDSVVEEAFHSEFGFIEFPHFLRPIVARHLQRTGREE